MKWYMKNDINDEIAISSRVRLARNIEGLPFPNKTQSMEREKVYSLVRNTLEKFSAERYNYIDMERLPDTEKIALLEDHLISKEFSEKTDGGRILITDENSELAIMLNEEDHIRIQVITGGISLSEAYRKANEADDIIGQGVKYAFDKDLGFLTSCPTNLGTGMRASVMLHLPAISAAHQMKQVVSMMTKIGLTVRGLYGEGSEADGYIYQISNQITLGISDQDTLEKLNSAVNRIIEKEKQIRNLIFSQGNVDFEDSLCRSYGLLKYSKKMTAAEFLKLWSNMRLASDCHLIPDIGKINLIRLLIEAMPAHIIQKYPEAQDPGIRDVIRSNIIKEYLK